MSDYMVGRKGGKDRYMVGYNESKSSAYKVGGGGSSVGQSSSEKLGGGDQASPAGAKSAFQYPDDKDSTYKDVGDKADNMNFGGSISSGAPSLKGSVAGDSQMSYTEKGDWSSSKDAMARRKAMMESSKKYMGADGQYNSPTVDLVQIKK